MWKTNGNEHWRWQKSNIHLGYYYLPPLPLTMQLGSSPQSVLLSDMAFRALLWCWKGAACYLLHPALQGQLRSVWAAFHVHLILLKLSIKEKLNKLPYAHIWRHTERKHNTTSEVQDKNPRVVLEPMNGEVVRQDIGIYRSKLPTAVESWHSAQMDPVPADSFPGKQQPPSRVWTPRLNLDLCQQHCEETA